MSKLLLLTVFQLIYFSPAIVRFDNLITMLDQSDVKPTITVIIIFGGHVSGI